MQVQSGESITWQIDVDANVDVELVLKTYFIEQWPNNFHANPYLNKKLFLHTTKIKPGNYTWNNRHKFAKSGIVVTFLDLQVPDNARYTSKDVWARKIQITRTNN